MTSPPVRAHFRALARAEAMLEADLASYLPLWKLSVPAEFAAQPWDFSRFGRGERFVHAPLPESEFAEVMEQVRRWGLDDFLKERRFEALVFAAG